MTYLKFLSIALITFLSLAVWAGADHDHGAPSFQAPKGGVLKSTHSTHFELVKTDNLVSLYAYNQEGKSLKTKDYKLSAELELPRKKASAILFTDKLTHWETKVDSQGAHRFTLKILIDDGKDKDYVKFTIENK